MASIDDLVKAANTKRVQVADLADAPKLQATIQSGGQYSVAVQRAGSNKMLDLADALSKINPTLREYTAVQGLQDQIGEKEAMQVADADIYKNLKDQDATFFEKIAGIDRRNRAFNNTLIKRAINNDLIPSMKAESDALLDLDKYKDDKSLLAATDEFMQKKWEDFSAQVGNEAATSEGARALWNAVTGPFKADMLAAYDKKKDDFIAAGQGDELGIELDELLKVKTGIDENGNKFVLPIDAMGLRDAAKNREKLMIEAGITDRQQRNEILLGEFVAQAERLIVNDRLDAAETMIDEMYDLKLNGKPIFRSGKAKPAINGLISTLTRAQNAASETSSAELRRQFTGEWGAAFRGLRVGNKEIGGIVSEDTLDTVERVFERLGVDENKWEDLKNQIVEADRPEEAFDSVLEGLAQEGGEQAMALYYGTNESRSRTFSLLQQRPIHASTYSPEKKTDLQEEFQTYHEEVDNTASVADWMKNTGKNFTTWPKLNELDRNLNRGSYILKSESYKLTGGHVKKEIKALTNADILQRSGVYLDPKKQLGLELAGDRYALDTEIYITGQLQEYAKDIADDFEGEDAIKQREKAIRVRRDELIEQEKQRFMRFRNSLSQEQLQAEGDALEEADITKMKEAGSEADGSQPFYMPDDDYESLVAADNNINPKSFQTVVDDRKTMQERGDRAQLARSLYNFGFTAFTKEAATMLAEADPPLDADDVRLFGSEDELKLTLATWREVIEKDSADVRGTLTDEDKEIQEEYLPYGIYSIEDLQRFEQSQMDLMRLERNLL